MNKGHRQTSFSAVQKRMPWLRRAFFQVRTFCPDHKQNSECHSGCSIPGFGGGIPCLFQTETRNILCRHPGRLGGAENFASAGSGFGLSYRNDQQGEHALPAKSTLPGIWTVVLWNVPFKIEHASLHIKLVAAFMIQHDPVSKS